MARWEIGVLHTELLHLSCHKRLRGVFTCSRLTKSNVVGKDTTLRRMPFDCCENSSVVERCLAKAEVEGSKPFFRFTPTERYHAIMQKPRIPFGYYSPVDSGVCSAGLPDP